jgi:very-short-patch-repair endonuclease
MAALLACGDQAVLSHHSAAALWSLRQTAVAPVHVSHDGDRGRKEPRIVVHRAWLEPNHVMRVDGLRVTTPARTIVDQAAQLKGRAMRETVERAQDLKRFHPEEIRAIAPGRRGTKALRALLDLLDPDKDNARSHLERLFLNVIRKARLPRPEVNHPIAERRRDFVWPAQRLVVEVDGYQYHSSREQMRRDRRRDRQLTALNWRPVRFTFEEVVFEPETVRAELTTLLRS